MVMGRKKQQEILMAVALGMVLGTGSVFLGAELNQAQANSGYYNVADPNEEIQTELTNGGPTGGSNPTAIVYVPPFQDNGTVTINPIYSSDYPWGDSKSSHEIYGEFEASDFDMGTAINMSTLQIENGYTGKVKIEDGTRLVLNSSGNRQNGAVIYSSQEGGSSKASSTQIIAGNNVDINYRIDNPTNGNVYGVYNNHGTFSAGKAFHINKWASGNRSGVIGNDDGLSTFNSAGIFSRGGSSTTIGDYFDMEPSLSAKGSVKGIISGIENGTKADTERNTFHLGDDALVHVSFTGKGLCPRPSEALDNADTLHIRNLYLANSDFTIGNSSNPNYNWMTSLDFDSSAAVVAGAGIINSNGTIGKGFTENADISEGGAADALIGIRISDNANVTADEGFDVTAMRNGYAKQSDALEILSNSVLTMGDDAYINNQAQNDSGTSDKETLATAVHAAGNSKITAGKNAIIRTSISHKNVASIADINLSDSTMSVGENSSINAWASNHDYDPNSVLYGANVFKSSTTSTADANLQIGANSHITVTTDNKGKTVGIRNSNYGTVSLENGSTITIAQTSADIYDPDNIQPEEIQQGHSGNIAGYQGYQAKKTTFGNNVTISVAGNTDTANASAYGSDNADGELEAGDNLTVTMDTKGYAASYGLSTVGEDSNHTGTTSVGKNLTVTMTSDGTAVGISNIGSQGTVVLGDNATVTTEGTAASYGVLNRDGANTTFKGAATITSHKDSELGTAAASYDEGSLIDITGPAGN